MEPSKFGVEDEQEEDESCDIQEVQEGATEIPGNVTTHKQGSFKGSRHPARSPSLPQHLKITLPPQPESTGDEPLANESASSSSSAKKWFSGINFSPWSSESAKQKKPPAPPEPWPLGFSFSPAGLLLPYHLGAVSTLQELGFITRETNLSGSSAGALAACCAAAEIDPRAFLQLFKVVQKDLRANGAAGRLYDILKKQLLNILPEDIHKRLEERPGKIIVAHATIFPPSGHFIHSFSSRADLIENLLASCNIPFYFAKTPTVTCRKNQAVDGYFSVNRKYFGCPPAGKHVTTVRVLPFRADQMRMKRKHGEFIAPDLQDHDHLLKEFGHLEEMLTYLKANPVTRWSLTHVALTMPPEVVEYFKQLRPAEMEEDDSEANEASETNGNDDIEEEVSPGDRRNSNQLLELSSSLTIGEEPAITLPSTSEAPKPTSSAFTLPLEWNPFASLMKNAEKDAPSKEDMILPLPGVPTLRWSPWELLRIALDASNDEILDELFELGRADSFRWCKLREMDQKEKKNLKV